MMQIRDLVRIAKIQREVWLNFDSHKQLPRGFQTRLAEQFGVPKQRVHQIVEDERKGKSRKSPTLWVLDGKKLVRIRSNFGFGRRKVAQILGTTYASVVSLEAEKSTTMTENAIRRMGISALYRNLEFAQAFFTIIKREEERVKLLTRKTRPN